VKITRYILIILGVAAIAAIIWYFKSIVTYILIAAVISLIGHPLVELLCKVKIWKFRLTRSISAAFTLLFLLSIIFMFFRIFIPLVVNQANEFAQIKVKEVIVKLKEPISKFENYISEIQGVKTEEFAIENYINDKLVSLFKVSHFTNFFGSLASVMGDIVVAIFAITFISFFFLKNDELFPNAILLLIPNKYARETKHIIYSISKLLKRYFTGMLIDVLAMIILISIGLSIVGLHFNNVLVIALFVGIMNVIPYIGPLIGISFGLIMGLAVNLHLDLYTEMLPLWGKMLIVFVIVQIIDSTIFQPLIYSNSVNAHPLEIFLVILIAANLAGIVGMVLAIPTYTILRVVAKEFFTGIRLINKLTKGI